MSNKKATTLSQLELLAERANAEIKKRDKRIDEINNAGYEANVLVGIKVNGAVLAIAEKMVDILIARGSTNGTIAVNGVDVAVEGLAALAYKAEVSESDLASALKSVINGKAEKGDVTALQTAINTLNGTGTGSVKKTVDEAIDDFATKVSNDGIKNTFKELVDWVAEHGSDVADMVGAIEQNTNAAITLSNLIGTLPAGATSTTIVAYIAEAIAALNIGDYAKTSVMNSAIASAIANYYTRAEIDNKLAGYVVKNGNKVLSENDYTTAEKTKLSSISAGATKVEASSTNGKIKIDGAEISVYTEPEDVLHGAWASDIEVNTMLTSVFGS
jgi:hypothetical protein